MKQQVFGSEKGIISPILREVKEKDARRSFEELKKRLYALREKAKNKSQFDRIITKLEAELLGTNGVSNDTIITPTPLARTEQMAVSVQRRYSVNRQLQR